jgi:hypothetical protein
MAESCDIVSATPPIEIIISDCKRCRRALKHKVVAVVIAVQLDFQGANIEQYDEINEWIGLLPGGPAASPQELFHWVAQVEQGFRVVDVWETREAFERFAQEKLAPICERIGIPRPSDIQFFEVHNYLGGRH